MLFRSYSANQDVGVRRYRNAAEDGRWRWIVFDQDFGFYNDTNSIARWMDKEGAGSRKTVENQLFRYLMSNEGFRDRYLTRFGELVQGPWASQALLTRFDDYIDVLRPEMTRHCERWSEVLKYSRWEKAVTAMRSSYISF